MHYIRISNKNNNNRNSKIKFYQRINFIIIKIVLTLMNPVSDTTNRNNSLQSLKLCMLHCSFLWLKYSTPYNTLCLASISCGTLCRKFQFDTNTMIFVYAFQHDTIAVYHQHKQKIPSLDKISQFSDIHIHIRSALFC